MSRRDDRALARRAAAGDEAAWVEIDRRYRGSIAKVCYRLTGSYAEDAIQDVFLRLVRGIGSYRGKSALSTWITRVAINECYMYLRPRARRLERNAVEVEAARDLAVHPSGARGLELVRALGNLSPTHRRAIIDFDIRGRTVVEAAADGFRPVGTYKASLHRGRVALRLVLDPRHTVAPGRPTAVPPSNP